MNLERRLHRLAAAEHPELARPPHSHAPSPRQQTLDELRRQMDAVLARSSREPAARRSDAPARRSDAPARRLDDLPFSAMRTASGVLWQRRERLARSQRVGRVSLDAAGAADAGVLAELALDPALAHASPDSWLFLDTETTGLGGTGALVFLIGLAAISSTGDVEVEQLLLAEPGDERALLERFGERVRAASLLVTFNGKAFDLPLLSSRLVLERLPPLPARPHLDLLHVARRLHRQRLGRCSLKRMERDVLGFERGPDIDGSEVGAIYSHFLRTMEASGLSEVVDHNYRDVVSMVALVALYGQRMPALVPEDLAGLARTLQRAGATRHAERVAHDACERGGGAEAYRIRAQLAKSRGDSAGAVRDFERLCRVADDPASRLELAKLYEHKLRQPACALRWLELGTSENCSAHARRVERLERKLRRDSS